MALHFTKKLTVPLDPGSKAKAFCVRKADRGAGKDGKAEVLVSFHGNQVALYSISTKTGDEEEEKEKF